MTVNTPTGQVGRAAAPAANRRDSSPPAPRRQTIEVGQLIPVIGKTYPLHRAPGAMRDLLAGHARGKLVITVTDAG